MRTVFCYVWSMRVGREFRCLIAKIADIRCRLLLLRQTNVVREPITSSKSSLSGKPIKKSSASHQQAVQLSMRCAVYRIQAGGVAAAEVVQCVDSTLVMARTGERINAVQNIAEASRSPASVASDLGPAKTGDLRVKLDR
jgi:hypothetical protein